MSKGFRKSLFGFNTDDVLAYIAATDKAAKTKISQLENEISGLKKSIDALTNENAVLSDKVSEYESKKEYIRIMSENIARIYLTAKTTSKLMIDNANESRQLIEDANKEHLAVIDDTQDAMTQIKDKISEASERYCKEIEQLYLSLENAKCQIDNNTNQTNTANEEFNALISENV